LTIFLATTIILDMTRTLWKQLRQSKPFESLEQEVYLQILVTAQVANRWAAEALRPCGMTAAQHNVLRILRGVRPESLPAGKIAERMVHHDPDLTRLLDRLVAAGLVEKSRDEMDRRVVNVRITKEGVTAVEASMKAVRTTLGARLVPLGAERLSALADLLESLRAAAADLDSDTKPDLTPQTAKRKRRSTT
jgi:DNA-binding MarR family transcriptional regulator